MAIFPQRCFAKISKSALLHNYNAIKSLTKSEVMAVVKANAYGHDALICAQILQKAGVAYLAVTSIDEGIYLRENGITAPILVLSHTPAELATHLIRHNLSQTVTSFDYAMDLAGSLIVCGVPLKIHIKVDTGMSRLGIVCQSDLEKSAAVDEIKKISEIKNLDCEGIFTHLSSADGTTQEDENFTQNQFELFENIVEDLKTGQIEFKYSHIANSAGTINYLDKTFNMVRCGLSLYGYSSAAKSIELKPILTLAAEIISVKNLPAGTPISYNRTHILQKDSTVATISAGYADGINRALSNVGSVYINGQFCPILGRVCMDYIMVDVTNFAVEIGDEAHIICDEITASEHAKIANTIEYEILCNISTRVPRILAD